MQGGYNIFITINGALSIGGEKLIFTDEFNELATLLGKTLSHGDRQSALIQHIESLFSSDYQRRG